ncbi:glycosyltransferase [Deinococcus sp. KSM4-11]|uniref:glycosyltransferase n=1 Tax=Deinococcus sp. KSM4-11 TaxID=2568654 RepID=UPI001454C9A3|nr:glycosyltransferase [Deinococcus sp. KSM4-11]
MKVSVITINFNSQDGFGRTHSSVRAQTYPDLEWVVIDSVSTDDSAAAVRAATPDIDTLVVEKDDGIADAFNKGIALATGEATVFLNAGDTFSSPEALAQMVAAWNQDKYDWLCAGAHFMQNGQIAFTRDLTTLPVDALVMRGCLIVHPSVILKTVLLRSFSGYDARYRSAMDFDLWVRLISRGFLPQQSALITSNFYLGGTSTSYSGFAEELQSLTNNGLARRRDLMLMRIRKAVVTRLGALRRYRALYRLKERLFR